MRFINKIFTPHSPSHPHFCEDKIEIVQGS